MSHLRAYGVNDAFRDVLKAIVGSIWKTRRTTSRAGDVLQVTHPVIVTYLDPRQRVLFSQARDANPFFHIMEALWMLTGRNDLAPLQYYVSTFGQFSDDGKTLNGAYGYRWRYGRGGPIGTDCIDQLSIIADHLREKPDSRRSVLQMWTIQDDLLKINESSDVCCNTNAYFLVDEEGRLDMTVCNRSNDAIWGMLGANVVHFSFLQEYLASKIGLGIGQYHQFTNNLHVYTERFTPQEWINDTTPNYYLQNLNTVPLVQYPDRFEEELKHFSENWLGRDLGDRVFVADYREPFFRSVAWPMAIAFYRHKKRDYARALESASHILSDDWRVASVNWLRTRQARYERAKDDGPNPYLTNELERLSKGE